MRRGSVPDEARDGGVAEVDAQADQQDHTDLPPGTRLPSERDLARRLAVSRGTVVAAYDDLRGRGLLDSVQGSGTRVAATAPAGRSGFAVRVPGGRGEAVFRRLVEAPDGVIGLARSGGEPPAELRAALGKVLEHGLTRLAADGGYQPAGLPALREAIACAYTEIGLRSSPEQVLITTGAHQAIALASQLYLRQGSAVVTEAPGWPGCLDVFRAAGARVVGVPMSADGIRADLLAGALREHRPALAFVTPTFQNPTGTLMSADRRRQVAELAGEHAVALVEDNPHLVFDQGQLPPVAAYDDSYVLSVGSLSKSVWPGLRIGWVRAGVDVIARLSRLKALADLGSPVLEQAVAASLVPRQPELAHRAEGGRRARLRHLTGLLRQYLPTWRWHEPAGGWALWIELPGTDAAAFAQLALRHGVEVLPGGAADPGGGHDSHVRLPFSYPPETLDELVHRLSQAWAARPRAFETA